MTAFDAVDRRGGRVRRSRLSSESDVLPSGYVLDGVFGDAFETRLHEP